jgi:hypothetical protein
MSKIPKPCPHLMLQLNLGDLPISQRKPNRKMAKHALKKHKSVL